MPTAGWYPDPDRTPGRYRFWDGRAWTDVTTSNSQATAPPPTASASSSSHPGPETESRRSGRRGAGLLIGGIILVVIIAIVITALVRSRTTGSGPLAGPDEPTSTVSSYDDSKTATPKPSPSATASSRRPVDCDQASPDTEPAPPIDGRVHGGPLSFAELQNPWTDPQATSRVPYSRDSQVQILVLPEKLPWQASVQVGISTFHPFPGGAEATSEMLQCVLTSDFYTSVQVELTKNSVKTITVGGKPATERDALITFSHPRLSTHGSLLRFVVVESDPVTYYFHAVPMERDDLITKLDTATRSLQLS